MASHAGINAVETANEIEFDSPRTQHRTHIQHAPRIILQSRKFRLQVSTNKWFRIKLTAHNVQSIRQRVRVFWFLFIFPIQIDWSVFIVFSPEAEIRLHNSLEKTKWENGTNGSFWATYRIALLPSSSSTTTTETSDDDDYTLLICCQWIANTRERYRITSVCSNSFRTGKFKLKQIWRRDKARARHFSHSVFLLLIAKQSRMHTIAISSSTAAAAVVTTNFGNQCEGMLKYEKKIYRMNKRAREYKSFMGVWARLCVCVNVLA